MTSIVLTPSVWFHCQDSRMVSRSRKTQFKLWWGQYQDDALGGLFGVDLGLFYRELRLNLWIRREKE